MKNKNEFLSNVKKDSKDRTLSENILFQAYYYINFLNVNDNKYLGAIETILVLEDFIKPGQTYEYKKYNKKFLFWNYTETQTYKSLMLEMAEKYLKSRNIL